MKKWEIKAVMCDARNLKEEILQQYESVSIQAVCLFVSEASRELLAKYHVRTDAVMIETIPEDGTIVIKNGEYSIGKDDIQKDFVFLIVNGRLEVQKGAQEAFDSFARIMVNGVVEMPDDLSVSQAKLQVNGCEEKYPADAVKIRGDLNLDKVFALRAKKETLYWASGRLLILTDEDGQMERLWDKQVKLRARHSALVAESLLEQAVEMIDETTDIIQVPDGVIYKSGEYCLEPGFAEKNGDSLFVDGSLKLETAEALEGMKWIYVIGTAKMTEECEEKFRKICLYWGELIVTRENAPVIAEEISVLITKDMLENVEETLVVVDCVDVKIDENVSPELIRRKLKFTNCINICCTREQEGSVRLVSEDCLNIEAAKEKVDSDDVVCVEAVSYQI